MLAYYLCIYYSYVVKFTQSYFPKHNSDLANVNVSVNECDTPEPSSQRWRSTLAVHHDVTVIYGCHVGYLFPDGSDRSYSYCDEPRWTHVFPQCLRNVSSCYSGSQISAGSAAITQSVSCTARPFPSRTSSVFLCVCVCSSKGTWQERRRRSETSYISVIPIHYISETVCSSFRKIFFLSRSTPIILINTVTHRLTCSKLICLLDLKKFHAFPRICNYIFCISQVAVAYFLFNSQPSAVLFLFWTTCYPLWITWITEIPRSG